MALPTCACVASLPPMQRWAAIAAMAQTWAGSTVTPIACARTFNEILNDLYCALYAVAEDGPAPDPDLPELLASFDISDPANIASFTRAGAAGFTTTGDSDELQREAAADALRIHNGGVLLEDEPTACALVAPGVPSVTPGELEFSATFTAIPITASLLRYDYQIDSDGWVSNGTSTTLTDIVATEGDHTLSVRAVSTSGVAGATATSASFTVTAPAGTPIFTGTPSAALQNNFDGWVGSKFVAGSAFTVTHLGRWKVAGNTGTHTVKLRDPVSGTDVASVSVDLTTGSAGDYVYTALGTPIVLVSGRTYRLASQETNGGDQWYDAHTLTINAAVSSVTSTYSANGTGFTDAGSNGYGPVNLKFTP